MSDRILVATRKGLFTVRRGSGGAWEIAGTDHLGDHLGLTMVDPRNGTILVGSEHHQIITRAEVNGSVPEPTSSGVTASAYA